MQSAREVIAIYNTRIEQDKIEKLYKLREMIKSTGEKTDMVKLVDEALARYIPAKEEELRQKRRGMKEINRNEKSEKRRTETGIREDIEM